MSRISSSCQRRCFHFSSVLRERKSTWVLPEITLPTNPSSSPILHNEPKRRNLKFASLNDGPSIPPNWRSMKNLPDWKRHKFALKEKFGDEGWSPKKKLSRETIDQIKVINSKYPQYNAKVLAEAFSMSPEAMRRILKSTFKPSVEESEKILERWKRRGERHLQYKLINKITDEFVTEKKEIFNDDLSSNIIEIQTPEELAKQVAKKLTGRENILKP